MTSRIILCTLALAHTEHFALNDFLACPFSDKFRICSVVRRFRASPADYMICSSHASLADSLIVFSVYSSSKFDLGANLAGPPKWIWQWNQVWPAERAGPAFGCRRSRTPRQCHPCSGCTQHKCGNSLSQCSCFLFRFPLQYVAA